MHVGTSGSGKVWFVILIGIIALAGAGYFIWYKGGTSYFASSDSQCENPYLSYSQKDFGLFNNASVDVSFEYPCDWTVIPRSGESGQFTVASPDTKGMFIWPIYDIDISDFTDGGTFTTEINGTQHFGHRYTRGDRVADFIYLPITDGTENNGIIVIYEGKDTKEKVDHLLSTMKF